MKRTVVALLLVLVCLFSWQACAETVEQNGFYVTLDTDKENYAQGEEIVADITMRNAGNGIINNIQIYPYVSEPYKLTDEQQTVIEVGSLTESVHLELDVFFSTDSTELPDTGDHFNLSLVLVCLVVSGCAVFMLHRATNGKRWLSFMLVLCLLVSSMPMGVARSAYAESCSLVVEKKVWASGQIVTVGAYVSYQYEESEVILPTATPTMGPIWTPTAAPVVTATAAPVVTPTAIPVVTPTATSEATVTAMPEVTPTATPEATVTATPEVTPTATPEVTPTATPEATVTATPEVTPTATPEVMPTATPEATVTAMPEVTPTATPEVTPTATPEATVTATPEVTPTATPEVTVTVTPEVTPTATPTATPKPTEVPTLETPEIEEAKAQSSTTVSLTWPAVENAAGYRVYRSDSGKNDSFEVVAIIAAKEDAETYQYVDSGLEPATRYFYKVDAFVGGVSSEMSGEYAATTHESTEEPETPPADTPAELHAPVLVYPALSMDEENPTAYPAEEDMTLIWGVVEGAEKYTVRLDESWDEDWDAIVEEEETTEETYTIPKKKLYEGGLFRARITAYGADEETESSGWHYFRVGAASFIGVEEQLEFGYEEDEDSSYIETSEYWEADVSDNWITLDPESGFASAQLYIEVTENKGDFPRTGTITFTNDAGGAAVLTVIQEGNGSSNEGNVRIDYPEQGETVDYARLDVEWTNKAYSSTKCSVELYDLTSEKQAYYQKMTLADYENIPKSALTQGHTYRLTVVAYNVQNIALAQASIIIKVEGAASGDDSGTGTDDEVVDTEVPEGNTEIIYSGIVNNSTVAKEDIAISWLEVMGADYYAFALRDLTRYPDGTSESSVQKVINTTTENLEYDILGSKLEYGHTYRLWIAAHKDDTTTAITGKTILFTVENDSSSTEPDEPVEESVKWAASLSGTTKINVSVASGTPDATSDYLFIAEDANGAHYSAKIPAGDTSASFGIVSDLYMPRAAKYSLFVLPSGAQLTTATREKYHVEDIVVPLFDGKMITAVYSGDTNVTDAEKVYVGDDITVHWDGSYGVRNTIITATLNGNEVFKKTITNTDGPGTVTIDGASIDAAAGDDLVVTVTVEAATDAQKAVLQGAEYKTKESYSWTGEYEAVIDQGAVLSSALEAFGDFEDIRFDDYQLARQIIQENGTVSGLLASFTHSTWDQIKAIFSSEAVEKDIYKDVLGQILTNIPDDSSENNVDGFLKLMLDTGSEIRKVLSLVNTLTKTKWHKAFSEDLNALGFGIDQFQELNDYLVFQFEGKMEYFDLIERQISSMDEDKLIQEVLDECRDAYQKDVVSGIKNNVKELADYAGKFVLDKALKTILGPVYSVGDYAKTKILDKNGTTGYVEGSYEVWAVSFYLSLAQMDYMEISNKLKRNPEQCTLDDINQLMDTYNFARGCLITLNETAKKLDDRDEIVEQLDAEINHIKATPMWDWEPNPYYDEDFYVIPTIDATDYYYKALVRMEYESGISGYTAKWNQFTTDEKKFVRRMIGLLKSFEEGCEDNYQMHLVETKDNNAHIILVNEEGNGLQIGYVQTGESAGRMNEIAVRTLSEDDLTILIGDNLLVRNEAVTCAGNIISAYTTKYKVKDGGVTTVSIAKEDFVNIMRTLVDNYYYGSCFYEDLESLSKELVINLLHEHFVTDPSWLKDDYEEVVEALKQLAET